MPDPEPDDARLHVETDNPTYADDHNFYKVEKWTRDGIEALEDGKPRPRRIWNKIPDKIRTAIIDLALAEPDLSLIHI